MYIIVMSHITEDMTINQSINTSHDTHSKHGYIEARKLSDINIVDGPYVKIVVVAYRVCECNK